MANITKEVWNILKSDLAIQKDIARGIVNSRALARYILDRYRLKASMDSVISAIRRFESDENLAEDKKVVALFKDSLIATKNNMSCATLSSELKSMPSAVHALRNAQDGTRVIFGIKNVKLIGDSDYVTEVLQNIPNHFIRKIEKDLSELSVTLNEKVIKTKGILARIANEISLSNINIEEIVITPPEFLIYVKQEDILKTYESLLQLRQKEY